MREQALNIPQVFNAALVVSVFATLAERISDLFTTWNNAGLTPDLAQRVMVVMFIVFWATKIFVDDHRSFATLRSGAHAAVTIIFSIATYCLLIAAAASVSNLSLAYQIFVFLFALLTAWVVVSLLRRYLQTRKSRNDWAEIKTRWVWLVINIGGFGCFLTLSQGWLPTLLPMAGLVLLLILDLILSQTFAHPDQDEPEPLKPTPARAKGTVAPVPAARTPRQQAKVGK